MQSLDTTRWYNKYINIPWKKNGFSNDGLDCYNLVRWVFKSEKNIDIVLDSDFYVTKFMNDGQYNFIDTNPFEILDEFESWEKATGLLKAFDLITLRRFNTDITNHCAIYTGDGYILHTNIKKGVHLSPFFSGHGWYNRMMGSYRWKN